MTTPTKNTDAATVAVRVTPKLRQELKVAASKLDKTIGEYIRHLFVWKCNDEGQI